MDVRAIILVGGLEQAGEEENERFAGLALATQDVLGKPVVWRVVERLKAQRVNSVAVISDSPMPSPCQGAVVKRAENAGELWQAAESSVSEMAQAGAEAVLVLRMGGYAEFDVDEFLQRHLDGRAHISRARDVNGGPLDMFMITASHRNDAAYLFQHRLQQTRSLPGTWIFRGYYNRLAGARDLRALAADALLQRAEIKPIGEQRRPGVWVGRRARIDRRARVLAPAFIGERAIVRAAAVVTRASALEHHAEVDSGTVVENATVLPFTYVGRGLDVAHAVAGGRRLIHLPRNVEVAIADPRLMDARSPHAPVRALSYVASLASYLPLQFVRGLLAPSQREQAAELPDAVKKTSPGTVNAPSGLEAPTEASSFPANFAVARRYGDQ